MRKIRAGTGFFSLTIGDKGNIIGVLSYLATGTILIAGGSDVHPEEELVNQITLDFGL
ncbi:MAG: hypothetical protein JSV99_05775 [Planctomycetota bacterium]|nr:MAG: hypothetical protein JSV99_05775 [Planctomycetota bacterium]